MSNIFRIVYSQQIIADSNNTLVETPPEIYFQISRAAATSGWLRESFGGQRNGDFAVLVAIGLHTRRLTGDDYQLFSGLGMVTPQDKDRLYARVTDKGLADILGRTKQTSIRGAINRLAILGLLRILPLPPNFRDSRGQFAGDRAYILLADQVLSQTSDMPGKAYTNSGQRVFGNLKLPIQSHGKNETASPALHLSLSAPDSGNESDRTTTEDFGNSESATCAGTDADCVPGDDRSQALWNKLVAVLCNEAGAVETFYRLLEAIEAIGGLCEAGLKTALRMLQPIPERRRRVLDDLRQMQDAQNLKPPKRKRNVTAILTYNVAATLGLGVAQGGKIRSAPQQSDFAAIGALANEYGAETVWLTTCEVAGAGIEGDPLNYLRATLRNKKQISLPTANTGSFDILDYQNHQVNVGVEQASN